MITVQITFEVNIDTDLNTEQVINAIEEGGVLFPMDDEENSYGEDIEIEEQKLTGITAVFASQPKTQG